MTIYIRSQKKFPLFFWFPLWLCPCRILAKSVLHTDPQALKDIIRGLRMYRRHNGRLTLVNAKTKEGEVIRIKV